MDVQVELVAEIDGNAQRLGIRARIGHRRTRRLLHHVAQLPREIHVALPRHRDHLDRQQDAAHLSPREAVGDTDQWLFMTFVRLVARRPQ